MANKLISKVNKALADHGAIKISWSEDNLPNPPRKKVTIVFEVEDKK